MSNQNRVLIIGLDGATWTVLKPWMEDGTLPNMANLRSRGCWGELRSTLPPLTAPAWSTFLTGKNPGKHGVYHFVVLDDVPASLSERKNEIVDARSIKSSTLWDILGHHERKVGVINVPMSYPPRPINGFMVTCLLTPPNAPVFTYPPELSKSLTDYQIDLDRFIDQKPFARDMQGVHKKRVIKPSLQLMQEFYGMEEKRARTALKLMDSEPWDAFMVVFTATDRMGHYLWPYHRMKDLDGTAESRALHEAIFRFYKRLDQHIGALVEKAGPGASVVIMSDHGMGPIYTKNTHWNNWLYKKGYLSLEKSSAKTADGWLLRLGLPRDRIRSLVKQIPGFSNSRIFDKARKAKTASIDFDHSKAYYVRIFDPVGGIRINEQGLAKQALQETLMEELKSVIDPKTDQPIVRWIYRREEVYQGPYADEMPDIILVMYPDYGSSDRVSNYSSIVTDRPNVDDPGGHHIEGIFMAAGPKIQVNPDPLPDLQLIDIAPTVLYLMELPIPSDMDGQVPIKAIKQASLINYPVRIGEPVGRWPSEADTNEIVAEMIPEEEEIVRDRLRALGYLD